MVHQLASIAFQLWPHIQRLRDEVEAALQDGSLTASEADALGLAVSREVDIKIKVHGSDILKRPAQHLLMRGLARLMLRLAKALREA